MAHVGIRVGVLELRRFLLACICKRLFSTVSTRSRGVAALEDSIIPMRILQPQLHTHIYMCVCVCEVAVP